MPLMRDWLRVDRQTVGRLGNRVEGSSTILDSVCLLRVLRVPISSTLSFICT